MRAVEHLKALCCLGLPPESATIALTPLLHEIVPHDGMRFGVLAHVARPPGGVRTVPIPSRHIVRGLRSARFRRRSRNGNQPGSL